MGLLIDSSVFIAIERAGETPSALFEHIGDEAASLAAISASELLHGVHRADGPARRRRREAFVEAILGSLPILPFTLEEARIHSRLWADLQARGEMIGAYDLLIAATALCHGLTLVSRDKRHFPKIRDLKLILLPQQTAPAE